MTDFLCWKNSVWFANVTIVVLGIIDWTRDRTRGYQGEGKQGRSGKNLWSILIGCLCLYGQSWCKMEQTLTQPPLCALNHQITMPHKVSGNSTLIDKTPCDDDSDWSTCTYPNLRLFDVHDILSRSELNVLNKLIVKILFLSSLEIFLKCKLVLKKKHMSFFQKVLSMDENDRLQIGMLCWSHSWCISCLIEFAESSTTIYSVDRPCMPVARRSCVLTPAWLRAAVLVSEPFDPNFDWVC